MTPVGAAGAVRHSSPLYPDSSGKIAMPLTCL
jgi:hypothetical protein